MSGFRPRRRPLPVRTRPGGGRLDLPRSRWSAAILALGALTAIAGGIQPLLIARFIDGILAGGPVVGTLVAIAASIAVILISELGAKICRARCAQDLRDQWRALLLRRAADGRGAFEDLPSRSNNDVETVISSLSLGRLDLALSLLALAVAAVGLGAISPIFVIIVLACAIGMLVMPLVFRRRIAARKSAALAQTNAWNKALARTVEAVVTLRRRHALALRLSTLGRVSERATRARRASESFEGTVDVAIGGVLFLNQLLIILVGWQLIGAGSITIGALVAALQFEDLLLTPMLSVTDSMTDIAGGRAVASELLADDPDSRTGANSGTGPRTGIGAGAGTGAVSGMGPGVAHRPPSMTAGGSPNPRADAVRVLASPMRVPLGESGEHLDLPPLTIRARDLILLTGDSGSGKTTLARLLAGERELGGPRADGERADGGCAEVAYLPAEEPALGDSLEEDITLGRPIEPSRLEAVLTAVDARSGRLQRMRRSGSLAGASLGERQRTALARALVEAPPVLILDEALGHLDAGSAAHLLALLPELGVRASVVVGHAAHDDSMPWTQRWHIAADGPHRTLRVTTGG